MSNRNDLNVFSLLMATSSSFTVLDLPPVQRAGVLPLVRQEGILWIGFAINEYGRGLIDFGGRRETKDRTVEENALRELREESMGVFDLSSVPEKADYVEAIIRGSRVRLYFIEFFGRTPSEISSEIGAKLFCEVRPEISGICWFTKDQVNKLTELRPSPFFTKIFPLVRRWLGHADQICAGDELERFTDLKIST